MTSFIERMHTRLATASEKLDDSVSNSVLDAIRVLAPNSYPQQRSDEVSDLVRLSEIPSHSHRSLQVTLLLSTDDLGGFIDEVHKHLSRSLSVLAAGLVAQLKEDLQPFGSGQSPKRPSKATIEALHQQLNDDFVPRIPASPTRTAVEEVCTQLHKRPTASALFNECRKNLPFLGKKRHSRLLSPLASLCAILPFLFRWPELFLPTLTTFAASSVAVERLFRDVVVTPWFIGVQSVLESFLKAMQEATPLPDPDAQRDALLLVSVKGNLRGAITVLRRFCSEPTHQEPLPSLTRPQNEAIRTTTGPQNEGGNRTTTSPLDEVRGGSGDTMATGLILSSPAF